MLKLSLQSSFGYLNRWLLSYWSTGRLRLEPICTTSECSDCVCVHPGDVVTCSTEGTMLSLWIGINDIDVKRSNSNGSNEYTAKSFSITNRHHKSTVRCYMYVEFEKRNIVFNSSATLYVLGRIYTLILTIF